MDMSDSLKSKTLTGLFWSFTGLFANQGIQFLILMILARMLTPEHFGLIGMMIIFITISNSIVDSGFSQALIREKDPNQDVYSTVFFYNIGISFLMYVVLYMMAPFISHFFNQGQLTMIIRIASLGIIINSFGIIHRVILIRRIDFKLQTKISLTASVLGGIVAILCARNGFGVWSLVIQSLVNQATQLICFWLFHKWKPKLVVSDHEFKRLFRFGSKLLASNLIDVIYSNVFSILIGRLYPVAQLGYYTNAVKIGDVITNSTTGALQKVTYPVLSTLKEDEEKLKTSFQTIIKITAYCMFPVMMGLLAVADTLIPLLLGAQWQGSVLYFQLLCLSGMLYPLHAINLNILQVKGRSDLFLRLEIIKKTLLTLLIGVSLLMSLGIIGLISAGIASSYLSLVINTYYSAKEVSHSMKQQFLDILPAFFISICMGGIVYLVGSLLPTGHLLKVLIQVICGISFYVLASWLFKLKDFELLFQYILKRGKKKTRKQVNSKGA